MRTGLGVLACMLSVMSFAQTDSILVLKVLEISAVTPAEIERMKHIEGATICAGKKNEILYPINGSSDLSVNLSRQVYNKVPGLMIWESDGSGIQTSIATRGLSPNRSWEFNMRQDGVYISADPLGYPEAYYTPPTEAIQRIEIIRGASALSFGSQFGGMINYKMRTGGSEGWFHPELRQTVGSYGLSNTFLSVGGGNKKFSYYSFFQRRTAEGWRENSAYEIYSAHVNVQWRLNERLTWHAEYSHSDFESQQPGGLTDEEYAADWRQSKRERNWMGTPWNIFSTGITRVGKNNDHLDLKLFGMISERNSVGYTSAINVADSAHFNRTVDRDAYVNFGLDLRYKHDFSLGEKKHPLTTGVSVFNGNTDRKQRGKGTAADDFDLTLVDPNWGRELNYQTQNVAAFAEWMIQVTNDFAIIPGVRGEYIDNSANGEIVSGTSILSVDQSNERNFILYGIGAEYELSDKLEIYTNYSRAYRSVMFADLTPSASTDVIDPNLKDANGFNSDFGIRGGNGSKWNIDLSAFHMIYNDRIGRVTENGVVHVRNVGATSASGIELFVQSDLLQVASIDPKFGKLVVFLSSSYNDARYTKWNNPAAETNSDLDFTGNKVEYAPQNIHRAGIEYGLKDFSLSWNYSSTSSVFTDANNTEEASANAQSGKIAGYELHDMSVGYKMEKVSFRVGVNNVFDTKYATRRAGGYPGPGLLPGQGRTLAFTAVFGY